MPSFANELFGQRLRLTRATLDDVDEVLAAVNVSFAELHAWMTWAETMPTRESLAEFAGRAIHSEDKWSYWIREIEGGLLVGGASLSRRGVLDELEIGYWVRSDRTGRGYATEAACVLTNAAFDSHLGVATVKISMDKANGASAAVPQKLGFDLDHSYERDILTPGHSGQGVAWVVRRDTWRDRTR